MARQAEITGYTEALGLLLRFLTANWANRANFSWLDTSDLTAKYAKHAKGDLGMSLRSNVEW